MKDTKRIFKISFTGVLIALMFAFSWTILGMVPIGTLASATTVFIPVVIGIVCLDDFRYTVILSISFGLVSLIRAIVPQGALDVFFINPLVSILPRLIMGLLTHLCYRLLKKCFKSNVLCASITGGLCALFNTVFTISTLILVNFSELASLLAQNDTYLGAFVTTILLTNMLPEIILGVITVFSITVIYNKINISKSIR